MESVGDDGVTIRNPRTHHRPILAFDQIREFMTDPLRDSDGLKHGFLHLKVQLILTGQAVRAEPFWK